MNGSGVYDWTLVAGDPLMQESESEWRSQSTAEFVTSSTDMRCLPLSEHSQMIKVFQPAWR